MLVFNYSESIVQGDDFDERHVSTATSSTVRVMAFRILFRYIVFTINMCQLDSGCWVTTIAIVVLSRRSGNFPMNYSEWNPSFIQFHRDSRVLHASDAYALC